MRREQVVDRACVQRIDNKQVCRRWIVLCRVIVDRLGRSVEFLQGRCEPEGMAANFRTYAVCGVFSCPADGHLHEHCCHRCEEGDENRPQTSQWTVPIPPPNIPANIAKFANIDIAPAIVAVTVMMSVSRFLTCASSCAITPAISFVFKRSRSPVVAATAAFSGFRPVAKAFGCASLIV